ncbi:hypothetical protein VNI00_011275 [Paramarasmius palmivorus]|uniref:BZIP domain-containing protein n=1 Tax=Paramarasmius palmivorus TaxID=297713 RepID=A0AAW0CFN9_9AGAR
MPRQRLYHTKEAKMEANRRKAREHYQRNKEDICAKRRLRYSNRKARDAAQASGSPPTAGEPTTTLPMEETISVPQSNVEASQMEVSTSSSADLAQHSTELQLRDTIERAGANEENDGLDGHADTTRESRERERHGRRVKKEHARRTRRRSTKFERAQQASKNRDTRVNEENQGQLRCYFHRLRVIYVLPSFATSSGRV